MTESHFQFHSPLFLLLLLLAPLIFFYEIRKLRLIKLPISSERILSQAQKTWRTRFEFLPALLKSIAFALLVIALARPQIGNENTEIKSEGVDIILTLDTSGSMRALDMELKDETVDRMTVVKSVVKDFVKGRQYDRIGMVVFGESAYTQCPLTLDYDILTGYLDLIEVGIAGDGTAIGNALATAVKRLENSQAKSKVVILLTDGKSNSGEVSPEVAADLARDKGVKVYTIAVGSNAKYVPMPVQTPFGTQIEKFLSDIDVDTLKMISEKTGGQFFRADSTKTLKDVYKRIDKLEKTEVTVEKYQDFEELYLNYLVPALVLLVLSWFLRQTVFLRIP